MSRVIPNAPEGYKAEQALIVTRTIRDDHAARNLTVPEGKPQSYSFWKADVLANRERMRTMNAPYNSKGWPQPQAHKDIPGDDGYKAVVGIVTFPSAAARNAALALMRGDAEPGKHDSGVVTRMLDSDSLTKDWRRVTSVTGAQVAYDQVDGAMERPADLRRADLRPFAYAAWEKASRAASEAVSRDAMGKGPSSANATIRFTRNGLFAVIDGDSAKTKPRLGPAKGRAFARIDGDVSSDGSLAMRIQDTYPPGMTEQHETAIFRGATREVRAFVDSASPNKVTATPAMNEKPGHAREFKMLKDTVAGAFERELPTALHVVEHRAFEVFNERGDERLEPRGHSLIIPTANNVDPSLDIGAEASAHDHERWRIVGRIQFTDNMALMRAYEAHVDRPDAFVADGDLIGVRVGTDARKTIDAILVKDWTAQFFPAEGPAKEGPSFPKDAGGKPMLVLTKDEVLDAIQTIKTGSTPKTDAGAVLGTLSSAIAQPQWTKNSLGQLKPTGNVLTELKALESLRDGFGSNAHRKLTLDEDRIDAMRIRDGHLFDKSFMQAAERVAASTKERHEAFVAARTATATTMTRQGTGASR